MHWRRPIGGFACDVGGTTLSARWYSGAWGVHAQRLWGACHLLSTVQANGLHMAARAVFHSVAVQNVSARGVQSRPSDLQPCTCSSGSALTKLEEHMPVDTFYYTFCTTTTAVSSRNISLLKAVGACSRLSAERNSARAMQRISQLCSAARLGI